MASRSDWEKDRTGAFFHNMSMPVIALLGVIVSAIMGGVVTERVIIRERVEECQEEVASTETRLESQEAALRDERNRANEEKRALREQVARVEKDLEDCKIECPPPPPPPCRGEVNGVVLGVDGCAKVGADIECKGWARAENKSRHLLLDHRQIPLFTDDGGIHYIPKYGPLYLGNTKMGMHQVGRELAKNVRTPISIRIANVSDEISRISQLKLGATADGSRGMVICENLAL